MKTEGLSREAILSGLPVAIYTVGLLLSWWWSPVLFERTDYPLAALVVLVILVIGAAWGIAQRLPLWSYNWVIFSVGSISRLLQANLAERAASAREFGVILSLVSLAALFAVIIIASFLSFRGMRFAIFAILLSLLHGALRFPVLEESPALSAGTANALTWAFATLAVAEAALAVFVVARFLGSQGRVQVRFLYLLAAIIFVDPLLNGWSISVNVVAFGGSFLNALVPALATIAASWVFTGLTLLLVWGLSRLAIRLTKGRAAIASS